MRLHPAKQVLLHVAVIVSVAALAFPIVLLLSNALKTEVDIFASPMGLPSRVTWENFRHVLLETTFFTNMPDQMHSHMHPVQSVRTIKNMNFQ